MQLAKQPKSPQRLGLLPEAHRVILPDGIAASDGPAIVATAEALGLGLDPWQKDIAKITWAMTASGQLASEIVGMSIPRQAGKTYLVAAMMFAYAVKTSNATIVWTAHHGTVMLETFSSLKALTAEGSPAAPYVHRVYNGAENRSIVFSNGSRILMKAREYGALRGVSAVNVLVLDEAQILTESALSDMLPTQNAATRPLTIMMGTPPRPKDPGEVFTQQRQQALDAEKAGAALEEAAWIEFCADPDAETDDHAQWRKANPSYPHRTPLRAIRKLRRALSEDHFRREALGIWDDRSTPSVIPPGVWAQLEDQASKPASKLVLGVDVSPDREVASVALAGLRADGLVHVELYEQRSGVGWLVDWISERCHRNQIAAVVIDAKSPAATLIPRLKKSKIRVLVTNTDDMANACAGFYDLCMESEVRHTGQVQLTRSLHSAAKRSIGDRWAWNRKTTDADITPIVAATLACWGVSSRRVRDNQSTSKGVVLSW